MTQTNSPAQDLKQQLHTQLSTVIYGLDDSLHALCLAILNQGHVLIEGVPGLGKTLLANRLAQCLGGTFKRIQGTADLMPSDMTGIHIYDDAEKKFSLIPGPLFADVVLVDEINRSSPKTQAALLQAMEEQQISIDRQTYTLSKQFMVLASQNPFEFEGTYPLIEAQLDRFLLRLNLRYPQAAAERDILKHYDKPAATHAASEPLTALDDDLLQQARQQVADVHVADELYDYVLALVNHTRQHPLLQLGLSTRGSLAVMRCARAEAALQGADFVSPEHVKTIAQVSMAHRLLLNPDAILADTSPSQIITEMLTQVAVPTF